MTIELLAPAKINLGLEVIRRRADGFHDIATVFQSISLFDQIRLLRNDVDEVQIVNRIVQIEANLAERALELARQSGLTSGAVRVEIGKRIPVAAGLGGASTDAAAVLIGLAALSGVECGDLASNALSLGSDVPFLLSGGAALAHGRGEVLSPVPSLRGCWLVLASPDIELEQKTARLYGALCAADFSDGVRIDQVARALESGAHPAPEDLANAFERPLYELLPALSELRSAFADAGAPFVALTGAGPTHYTIVSTLPEAIALAHELWQRAPIAMRVLVARPIAAGPIAWDKTRPDPGTL